MAEPKIEVPVEIGGPAAVAEIQRLKRAVDSLERSVDKLGDKADEAGQSVSHMGEGSRRSSSQVASVDAAASRSTVSLSGLAGAFGAVVTAAAAAGGAAIAAGRVLAEQAAQGDRTQAALAGLGNAYEQVQRATNGTVTAQEAYAAQQRIVRSGLRVSGEELARVTRYAREYARATGTETTQALERLSDALVEGSADAFQEFGIRVQEGVSRAQAFEQAMRSMEQQQRGQQPVARSLAEDTARLGSALTDAAQAMASMASDSLGLQGIIGGLADTIRGLANDLQDIVRIRREVSAGEADMRRRGAAVATFQAAQREARAAFIERGGTAEQFGRALPPPDTLNRLTTEQLERAATQLRSRFSGTRSTAGVRGALAAAEQERLQGRRFGAIDGAGLGDLFGASATAASVPRVDAGERSAILSDLNAVVREMAGDVARNGRPPRTQPRDRINAGAPTPATTAELREARAALAAALIQRAQADALGQLGDRGERPFDAAVQGAFTDRGRAQRLDAARSAMSLTGAQQGENEAQRINRIAQATREYAEAMREQAEADRAASTAAEAAAEATKARTGELDRAMREAANTSATRVVSDALAKLEEDTRRLQTTQEGEWRTFATGNEARLRQLTEQRAAMRDLITTLDTRIAQAREQGAAEAEINALLTTRLGLVRSMGQADGEAARLQRERSAGTREYRDSMVSSLGGVAEAFGAATQAAIDGEQSFAQALQGQLRAVLSTLAKESVVNVLKNLAMAAFSAATLNPVAATNHLAAAGLWAATGVAAGAGAAAIPKPTATPSGSSAAPPRAASLGPSRTEREAAQPFSLNITVNGALFDGGVERAVIRAIDHSTARGHLPRHLQDARAGAA